MTLFVPPGEFAEEFRDLTFRPITPSTEFREFVREAMRGRGITGFDQVATADAANPWIFIALEECREMQRMPPPLSRAASLIRERISRGIPPGVAGLPGGAPAVAMAVKLALRANATKTEMATLLNFIARMYEAWVRNNWPIDFSQAPSDIREEIRPVTEDIRALQEAVREGRLPPPRAALPPGRPPIPR